MDRADAGGHDGGVSDGDGVELSVVVPVYGCAATVRPLHERLTRVLISLRMRYEIVFIDDRSRDGAWTTLQEIARWDPHVVACRMSRNVGQQLAITAGLEACGGQHAVVLDCDLQDPPELIPLLLAGARDGFDIVFARRKSDHQGADRLRANRIYFRALSLIVGQTIDGELGAFSIISRRVIDAFLQFQERDRHYVMLLQALGFDTKTIDYERATRPIGRSSYRWSQLVALALSGVFFTTTRLLHWVIYAGLLLAISGFALAVIVTLRWLFVGAAPGWTSLVVAQLLTSGVITLCLGITALYVGRIFEEVKRRPLYFIQDRIGGRGRRAFDAMDQAARTRPAVTGHAPALERP